MCSGFRRSGVPENSENECVLSSPRATGKSRVSRFVLGFYRSEEHGEEALREARKKRVPALGCNPSRVRRRSEAFP